MYRKRVQICVFLMVFLGLLATLAVLFYVYPVKCEWCEYLTCIPITDKFCEKYDLNAHLLWPSTFEVSAGLFLNVHYRQTGQNISKCGKLMKMKTEYGAAAQVVTEQEHFSGIIFPGFHVHLWISEVFCCNCLERYNNSTMNKDYAWKSSDIWQKILTLMGMKLKVKKV